MRPANFKDITGLKFNKLIAKYRTVSVNHDSMWSCLCECGGQKVVSLSDLQYNKVKSCGCIVHNRIVGYQRTTKGYQDISFVHLNKIKKSAKVRGFEWAITPEYIWQVFSDQKELCAISGQPIKFVRQYRKFAKLQTASVDRKNPELGYIEGNIQIVHKDINTMKWIKTTPEFIEICRQITQFWQGRPLPSV